MPGSSGRSASLVSDAIEVPEVDRERHQVHTSQARDTAHLDLARVAAVRHGGPLTEVAVLQYEVEKKYGTREPNKADWVAQANPLCHGYMKSVQTVRCHPKKERGRHENQK